MSKHLINRKGHFYYRQWIPLDLRNHFDGKADITISLKTREKQEALTLLGGIQQKYQLTFTLLRSGVLSKEHQESILSTYTFNREKPIKRKSVRLSELYSLYYAEKSPAWVGRTPGELNAQFVGLVKVVGDDPAEDYERADFIAGRDKLLERLSVRTVNKYMALLSSVLRWGVKHEYISRNPAEGLQLDLKKRADEERKAYDLEDIQRIAYTLCSSSSRVLVSSVRPCTAPVSRTASSAEMKIVTFRIDASSSAVVYSMYYYTPVRPFR